MNKYEIIGYASDFVSFVVRRKNIAEKINKIILFGSVARGDFDKESDVDIFIDADENMKEKIHELLKLYNSSKQKEFWELSGIRIPISLKIGNLDNWKSIKRSVLTDGIILYGKYDELPKNMNHYAVFSIKLEGRRSIKLSIWRKLYGYRQKIGKNIYEKKGLVNELGGKKIEKSLIAIPIRNIHEAYKFLRKYKINYKIYEIWTDSFYPE